LANREISAEELRQFAEDHLGKLKALPALPAEIAALLAPTDTAFDAFDAKLASRTTYLSAQMGGTVSKDEVLQLFRSTVRQREGACATNSPKAVPPTLSSIRKGS
jgi:hypothetical protein